MADESKQRVPAPDHLKGLRVRVVGFGRSGRAAARLLRREGARVSAVDDHPGAADAAEAARWASDGVDLRAGDLRPEDLDRPDLVVVSPGVPPSSPWMQWAAEAGVPVIGELELGARAAKAPLAAITGTNGKSTTTELLGDVVRRWGRPVAVGGNIGRALSGLADGVPPEGWLVVEVSSFQLETIDRFRPRVALHLNLTPDHLDRYGSVDAYADAKARIFENQGAGDCAVLNLDDPRLAVLADRLRAARRGIRVLGSGLSQRGEEGAWVEGGRIVVGMDGAAWDVCAVDEVRIPGPHNLSNALSVAAAARWMGAPREVLEDALRSFSGLPHRMEPLGEVGGVSFVNDSKATNIEAVLAALDSFERPVVLIAGGRGKGLDFSPLADAAAGRVKAAVLIGEAADPLAEALRPVVRVERAGTLEDAVRQAARHADPGDTVLLSPACASFDMFKNFEDRGDRFREAVRALKP